MIMIMIIIQIKLKILLDLLNNFRRKIIYQIKNLLKKLKMNV